MLLKNCARILPYYDLTQLVFVLHKLGKGHVNELVLKMGKFSSRLVTLGKCYILHRERLSS